MSKGPLPGIPKYINDGKGRDTYISFFNGGFSNYPYSNSYKKDFYDICHRRNHPDLYKNRPINKYNMDGNGRDFFIHQNILSEHCRLKDSSDFTHMLRNGIEFSPVRFPKSYGKTKFEKNLLNRIFYGNCSGVKDRLMEPKVKFNKKFNISNLKYNITSPVLSTNEANEDIKEIDNTNRSNQFKIDMTDNNNFPNKKISLSTTKKRSFRNLNIPNENCFIKTIQSLYSFNHKKNKIDLPILK
jgi:hypothetical protein